jgi:dipeptidyl-peptidase-4
VFEGGSEESKTGWIGDGGQPARPIFMSSGRDYYSSFSDDNGYWHIAKVSVASGTRKFLPTGTNVVTSLYGLDEANGWIYFRAAYPYARSRHLIRTNVNTAAALTPDQWQCITCGLDEDRCGYVSTSFSPSLVYASLNCGGPDVPMTYLTKSDSNGEWSPPEVLINNDGLIAAKNSRKWYIKEYGEYESSTGITFLYQMYKPQDFDEKKKYPMMIEVYGGPGFQKVRDSWTDGWSSTHLVSQYDIITVNLDARGSGYRGDGIAHMMYKKLGQFEKKDNTELANYLAQKYDWIDETRVAIWGWSYGGYATTHTISEGSGVFKCGLAVAPLATRFLYDSIHTERYMDLPKDNEDGYEQCSILNTNLDNFKRASYSIIHGTADDNVHFQNSALITKALIEADVDFDDFFYADEAHSISYGPNSPAHIYKLLTKKTRHCFNLEAPPSTKMYSRLRSKGMSKPVKELRISYPDQEDFERMIETPHASRER